MNLSAEDSCLLEEELLNKHELLRPGFVRISLVRPLPRWDQSAAVNS
jgi:hypothetical protein